MSKYLCETFSMEYEGVDLAVRVEHDGADITTLYSICAKGRGSALSPNLKSMLTDDQIDGIEDIVLGYIRRGE